MAWLYKRGGVWWIGWRQDGKQYLRTTGHTDKTKAEKERDKLDMLKLAHSTGSLTDEFYASLTGRTTQRPKLADYLQAWIKEAEGSGVTHGTMLKYRQVAREFLDHTDAEATGLLLGDVTPDHLRSFFAWKRERAALSTVAGFRRILRSVFLQAQEEGKIPTNPVQSANRSANRTASRNETTRKRPFTLEEIKELHRLASPFWKYMIQVAFFTGMRMGDAVTLQRGNVDFQQGQIAFYSRKTGKSTKLPLHPALRTIFQGFPKGKAEDYYWPEQAERYTTAGASGFSQEFYALMARAGIVAARDPKKLKAGKGRAAKRELTPIGFHNLRHTFVSMLKLSGANDSIAKELAGHRSDAISAVYTHLPNDALAAAINKLPGF